MRPCEPWLWRSLPLWGRPGRAIFQQLFLREPIAVLLESPAQAPTPQARYSICAGSPRRDRQWVLSLGEVLPTLQTFPQATAVPEEVSHLPFAGGWLGWLGYELAWEIEALPPPKPDPLPFPVAFWYEPQAFAVLDHQADRLYLAASSASELAALQQTLEDPPPEPSLLFPDRPSRIELAAGWQSDTYQAAVEQILHHIRAGDIFQANLSARFCHNGRVDPWQQYLRLQQINPSPFASFWQTPWGYIVSCSPERLVQVQGDWVQTRPIAGTRPRGQTPAADRAHAEELRSNTKEQAEHIMLVDLERNDLGRICQWGSVVVDELLSLEYYSHVMHLVSNVRGKLQPRKSPVDVICALFPGGTITGCPKVRCMEILAALEPFPRNLFYGSCGYWDQRGHLDLNILIRTLLVGRDRQTTWGQVGAGIVADSDPEREWQESLSKAQALLLALGTATPIATRS
ncbi:MAG: anthranilate synthase component I [Thermosynechococcus sp.]|uniref:anthranilate synthase component I n=1 Tax=Thermosynechococcus sp. TaxID=2814275 RepID=UPI0022070849|nr:anthranilate synthase component I [Thermosynechococcus sp.]BCX12590.1 MAG: anthranilate synthase component I [Thermosynechococcus sp.]